MTRFLRAAAAVAAVAALGSVSVQSAHASTSRYPRYASCAQLNAKFPHGVAASSRTHDRVRRPSDRPVTNFSVNATVYKANASRLDRDHDGIACEKH